MSGPSPSFLAKLRRGALQQVTDSKEKKPFHHPTKPYHRRKPWFQRYDFILGFLALIILYAFLILPEKGQPSSFEWGLIILFGLLTLGWVAIVTLDPEKPAWLGGVGAIGFMVVLGWIIYGYSGAQWKLLGRMFFNRTLMSDAWGVLLTGLDKTLALFVISAAISIVVGLILAVTRSFNNIVLNTFIVAYIDFFRSIPLLALVIVVYYALPFLGIQMGAYMAGIVSLSLSSSAFVTEYFRSGIESVHRGQVEASRSLGFNLLQTMRLVILPQAFRVVIPPLTGQMVGLIKATAIVSVVGLQELLKRAQEIMEWKTNPTPLFAVTIIYLIILLPLAHLSGILEKRMKKWVKKKA